MIKRVQWEHIPLIILTIFAMAPLLLMLMTSLKSRSDLRNNPLGFPKQLIVSNYSEAWILGGYGQAFMNSLIIGLCTIVIISFSAGLAAFALAKMKFKASAIMLGLLLFVMSIPMGMYLVPLFFAYQRLGLMDTLVGIIIIYSAIFLPFNIFLLRSFFVNISDELLDSARVDGCTEISLLYRMIFPLSLPAFSTVALIVGLWTWNEFFFANAFLQSSELKTVSTKYLVFTTRFGSNWSMISAAGMITIAPIIVLFLLLQRKFIEGISEGSIKG